MKPIFAARLLFSFSQNTATLFFLVTLSSPAGSKCSSSDGIILPRSWLISFGSLYALELIFKLYSSLLKHVAVWLQATWQIRWLHMSLRSSNASLQNQGSSLEVTIGASWNWKNLPEEVKLATSITSFKSLVKAHFYELSLEQCQFSLFSPS